MVTPSAAYTVWLL